MSEPPKNDTQPESRSAHDTPPEQAKPHDDKRQHAGASPDLPMSSPD